MQVFKKEYSEQVTNYRPVALLPSFSKIIEKVAYNQITINYSITYRKNNLLNKQQFGFRPRKFGKL